METIKMSEIYGAIANKVNDITFLLDNTGKFNIKYNYDDVLKSEFTDGERQ